MRIMRSIVLTINDDVTWKLDVIDYELIMDGFDVLIKIKYIDPLDHSTQEYCCRCENSIISEDYTNGNKSVIKVKSIGDLIEKFEFNNTVKSIPEFISIQLTEREADKAVITIDTLIS
jgi:hypothetical protein